MRLRLGDYSMVQAGATVHNPAVASEAEVEAFLNGQVHLWKRLSLRFSFSTREAGRGLPTIKPENIEGRINAVIDFIEE